MKRFNLIFLTILLLILTSCQQTTAVPTPTTAPTPTPTNTPPPAPIIRDLTIPQADNTTTHATLTIPNTPAPPPVIILLHMLDGDSTDWHNSDLLLALHNHGYATLTVDLRGHGRTAGPPDWPQTDTDLQVVWQQLQNIPEVDATATAVLGASIGANLALRLAANVYQIDTALLLSPGFDYEGVSAEEAIVNYTDRPLFIAFSDEDTYSAGSSRFLYAQTQAPKQIEALTDAGHGSNMLAVQPEPALISAILTWLDTHLIPGDPEPPLPSEVRLMKIARSDFITLDAFSYDAANSTNRQLILFANMNDNLTAPWHETAVLLTTHNYDVLTFNYRGAGNAFINERDDDILAIITQTMRFYDQIIVIGASIGGAATLKTIAAHPDLPVAGIVIIAAPSSLGTDPITDADLAAITIPQLYLTSDNDRFGLDATVADLYQRATEPKQWQTLPGTAHGNEIFATDQGPQLQTILLEFITATFN